jgi:transcriptional regulator with XRE-family HTH domain
MLPVSKHLAGTDSFGKIIQKARKAKRMTQKEVADACLDVSSMSISQFERGERIPKLNACRQIAKALEIDEKYLVFVVIRAIIGNEIKDLFPDDEAWASESNLPFRIRDLFDSDLTFERMKNLFVMISNLPQSKRDEVLNMLEAAVTLASISSFPTVPGS